MLAQEKNTLIELFETFDRQEFLYEGQMFQSLLQTALQLVDCTFGYLHLFDAMTHTIQLNVWSRDVLPVCTTSAVGHYPLEKAGIWADAIRQSKPVIHNDYESLPNKQGLPQGHFRLLSHMGVPIFEDAQSKSRVVAIVGVGNRPKKFLDSDAAALAHFFEKAWPAAMKKLQLLQQRRMQASENLEREAALNLLANMVGVVTNALALRDEYTAHHQENVADIAVEIGRVLGLSETELMGLRIGGLVHDLGKIAVPSEILNKTGVLHPAEYRLLQTHAERGAALFEHLVTPWPIVQMVAQHHERLDGSGYPLNLRSEQIIQEARILAVADVFDSMASDRPYRYAPGIDAAFAELRSGRGRLYDPYVVDAFFEACSRSDASLLQRYVRKHREHVDDTQWLHKARSIPGYLV